MAAQKDGSGAAESDGVKLSNKLSESRSPYVKGHMHNPVAWQMWTPEALDLAKQTNRLIFVSIGYSACHWCHVMERESFENAHVADILNESFIPIKVDREERPDIDRIYMNYVQAITGGGGWPLNVFLTPDLEPLFGGTYWPGPGSATQSPRGAAGFLDILAKMRDVWKNQRARCLDSAKEITGQLRQFAQEGLISHQGRSKEDESDSLDLELLEEAYEHFTAKFDRENKGFGTAPKFPTPANMSFLLRLGQGPTELRDVVGEKECKDAESMVLDTLRAMWRGGIKDQVGHGFARYSVTRDWSLPHFEKMLYDQGQLLSTYLDAYLISKDAEFLEAVHDIATYLTSPPLASSEGGFFSAEDADSYYKPGDKTKREGAFYVWTQRELVDILGERDAHVFSEYHGVKADGNVDPEYDAHDELTKQNVLFVSREPAEVARYFGLSQEETLATLRECRQKLLQHREKERPRPALDDKIVVAWNGLAIGALARTSSALTDADPKKSKLYLDSAIKAADFIKKELYDSNGGLLKRVYREGPGDAPGFADDYAFLISGLVDLYEATFDDAWLEWADKLQKTQISLFHDEAAGGFFSTAADQPDIILRLKDGMDNAEPSTNGVTASNLNRLSALFDDAHYAALAKATVHAFEAEIMQHAFLYVTLLDSVVSGRLGVKSVLITGAGEVAEKAVRSARSAVGRNRTVARVCEGSGAWLRERNPLFRDLDVGRDAVQICEAGTCRILEGEAVERALS